MKTKNTESKMQAWAKTPGGRRSLLAIQAAIIGIALISILAEVLSK